MVNPPARLAGDRLLSCEKSRWSRFVSFYLFSTHCAFVSLCFCSNEKRQKPSEPVFTGLYVLSPCPFPVFCPIQKPFCPLIQQTYFAHRNPPLRKTPCGQKTTPLRRIKKSCGSLHQSPFEWGIVRTAAGTRPLFTQKHRPRPGCCVGYPFFSGIWL